MFRLVSLLIFTGLAQVAQANEWTVFDCMRFVRDDLNFQQWAAEDICEHPNREVADPYREAARCARGALSADYNFSHQGTRLLCRYGGDSARLQCAANGLQNEYRHWYVIKMCNPANGEY